MINAECPACKYTTCHLEELPNGGSQLVQEAPQGDFFTSPIYLDRDGVSKQLIGCPKCGITFIR